MERKTIGIMEVIGPKEIRPGLTKYSIKGEDGVIYETFNKSIGDTFQLGTKIDAEIEIKTSPDGRFTNHQIKQVFVNGQAVASQGKSGGGFRTDPETQKAIALINRASIEKQTALKELGECIRTGQSIPPGMTAIYWNTLKAMIGGTDNGQPAAPDKSSEQMWGDMSKEAPAPAITTLGEFTTWAYKNFHKNPTEVCAILGVKATAQITDIPTAMATIKAKCQPAVKAA